jgi:hypothetical protein
MVIIYDNNGSLSVLTPAPKFLETLKGTLEQKLIHIANKDLPTGTPYEITDADLSDDVFFNAWEYVAGTNELSSADLSRLEQFNYNQIKIADLTDAEKAEFGVEDAS